MFKRRETGIEEAGITNHESNSLEGLNMRKTNTILKGSKLTGDINISCDMELSGEVEGNITSEQDSNIVIKGKCKGNIKTREGNVTIDGEMNSGDITAGGDVTIMGKFNGGKIEAKRKIFINGEFNGKLESNEIEIGPAAQGNGELLYSEYISISRGAKVDVQISQMGKKGEKEEKEARTTEPVKLVNIERTAQELREAK